MSLIPNDIPLLEYDSDPGGVILPGHERLGLRLPEKAVFAFLGDAVDRYAEAHHAVVATHFESATKAYPVYLLDEGGQRLCLAQAPVGAPAAVQLLDWLIAYGAREIISGGSCGALDETEEGCFLIPSRALRDEGTSYHYLPPSRFVEVSERARAALRETLAAHALPCREVTTWSTDGFFRETKEKTAHRRREGCAVVEMECAALAACAKLRGVVWGELLFTADTLANVERYDARGWGRDAIDRALALCIEAALRI